MSKRALLIAAIAAVLAVAGGAYYFRGADSKAAAPEYGVEEVRRGTLVATVSATGTLSPVITVQVGSQVSGAIQRLNADFNSRVRKGEVIARIDPALFEARLAEAEANLRSAEAGRDKAAVAVQDARRQLERVTDLRRKNLIAESELDAAGFALKAAEAELAARAASAGQALAARDREKVNLAYTTIYAPIDGVVISRNVDVGQTVAASLQAPTLFTIAQDLGRMQIETDVDEAFIGMVQEGQPVSFTVFAYREREFHGRVSQVRLAPKVEAGVVKYNCIIQVDNDDLALKPGMTATVTIETGRRENILKVGNAALRFVPELPPQRLKEVRAGIQAGEALLWSAEGGELKPVKVVAGLAGEQETEVSGAQLREGMRIAVPARQKNSGAARPMGMRLF